MNEEDQRALWAKALVELDQADPHRVRPVVKCSSTARSTGCGHPVDWHTGPMSPNPMCPCCSWRQNDVPPQDAVSYRPSGISRVPDGMPPEKWAMMNRAQRRAYGRKGGRL
jgi:hypothetical protein